MSPAATRPGRLGGWLPWSPTAAVNAFKTAVGLIIAWGLVLWFGWPDPFLAPLAVLFLQTPYLGASLRKGLMRVFGTLAGAFVILVLLAWFIQDPWVLLGALSLLIGLAVYQISASRYGYAWFMVAITATIIAADAVPAPELAFQLAVYRTSEAVLGILIVLVVNGIFWPQTAGLVYHREFSSAVNALAGYLRALAAALRAEHRAAVPGLPKSSIGASVRLREILTAAALDTGGFRQRQRTYEAEIRALSAITGSLMAFAENLRIATEGREPVLQAEQCALLAEQLEHLAGILEACREAESLRAAARRMPTVLDEVSARVGALAFSARPQAHAGRSSALLQATIHQCRALTSEIRQLGDAAGALAAGHSLPADALPREVPMPLTLRLKNGLPHALVAVVAFWCALLIWFQWQWPAHGLVAALMAVVMVGIDTINDLPAERPGHRVFFGALWGTLLTAPLYLLVMPRLDGFLELALALFPFYFAGLYFFHAHAKPHNLPFLGLLLMSLLLIELEPVQSYSWLGYANAAASTLSGFFIGLLVLGLMLGTPPQMLLRRKLQELLDSIVRSQRALAQRDRADFIAVMEVSEERQRALLRRLAQIAPVAWDPRTPQNTPPQIDELVCAAQRLSIQARALQRARARFRGAPIAEADRDSASGAGRPPGLGRRYRRLFGVLMRQIAARLDDPRQRVGLGALDRQRAWVLPELARLDESSDPASIYLLTIAGYYIGVARALRAFTAAVEAIDWAAWRQPRL